MVATAITYEQKLNCLRRLYFWIKGRNIHNPHPEYIGAKNLSCLLDRKSRLDDFDLTMAAAQAKQYNLVIVLENDDYVWLGDYETIKEIIAINHGHHIEKVY